MIWPCPTYNLLHKYTITDDNKLDARAPCTDGAHLLFWQLRERNIRAVERTSKRLAALLSWPVFEHVLAWRMFACWFRWQHVRPERRASFPVSNSIPFHWILKRRECGVSHFTCSSYSRSYTNKIFQLFQAFSFKQALPILLPHVTVPQITAKCQRLHNCQRRPRLLIYISVAGSLSL